MYWEDDLNQGAIADRLGYSPPTVSRMLAEARKEGIVSVTVSHPLEQLMDVERELKAVFGLAEARVCPDPRQGTSSVGPDLARAAGEVLLEHCSPRSVIAVSNGQAVSAVVHHLPERTWPRSTTVAMLGSTGQSFQAEDGPETCRNLALHLGGHYRSLAIPLVFDSLGTAKAVRDEGQVLTTLELAARSDVALTGVGTVGEATSSLLRRWMTPAVVAECRAKDVVAHVCGHHVDSRGRHVRTSLCGRTVCLDLERLTDIPVVIGVACGPDKVQAITAALRGGYLTALVTDESTAEAVLDLQDPGRLERR